MLRGVACTCISLNEHALPSSSYCDQVGAKVEGEYVDRESLVWRSALCPTEVGLLVEHRSECKVRKTAVGSSKMNRTVTIVVFLEHHLPVFYIYSFIHV